MPLLVNLDYNHTKHTPTFSETGFWEQMGLLVTKFVMEVLRSLQL